MPVHIRQPSLDSIVIESQPRVIDAQQMQCRCVQVVAVAWILDGLESEFIGCPVTDSAFDTAAGKPCRESAGVVVSAFSVTTLRGWLTTKLRGFASFGMAGGSPSWEVTNSIR